jgi:hypothetical protein
VRIFDNPTPHDSHTLALFLWNEAAGATYFKNEITGTLDMWAFRGSVHAGGVGPFGDIARTGGLGGSVYQNGITQDVAMMTATNAFQPANYLTVSVWVYIIKPYRDGLANDGRIITKPWAGGSWPSPYQVAHMSCALRGLALLTQIFDCILHAGSSGPTLSVDVDSVPIREWTLLSMTYDGAQFVMYVNGRAIVSTPLTGAIQWQSGCAWILGLPLPLTNEGIELRYGPLWIEDIGRSVDYILSLYQAGIRHRY